VHVVDRAGVARHARGGDHRRQLLDRRRHRGGPTSAITPACLRRGTGPRGRARCRPHPVTTATLSVGSSSHVPVTAMPPSPRRVPHDSLARTRGTRYDPPTGRR
jgi:hypothetical protein